MNRLVNLLFATSLVLSLCLLSCNDDEPTDPNSLAFYIQGSTDLMVQDSSVIACAAGKSDSLNVYYYPAPGYSDFRLWQLVSASADPADFSNYQEVQYPEGTLFNGYLRYFLVEDPLEETWVTITGSSTGELVVAQPIRLKQVELPTEINPDVLMIDQSELLHPSFSWTDGAFAGTAIYFHVISDANGDLISGTYTTDRFWQFYDLSNVVLNIRDVSPPPALEEGKTYTFSMMGVSRDNWVNLLLQKEFSTE